MAITDGIISAWRMEDVSGNLSDFVGSNSLTATNLTYHQPGKVNFATGWNGSNSLAVITNAAQSNLNIGPTDDRTIAIWFKLTNASGEQTIFGKPDDAVGGPLYEIIIDSSGVVNVIFGNLSGSFAYVRSNTGFLNNAYHLAFITFTRSATGLRLWMDNTEFAGGSQPSPANSSSVGDLTNAFDFRVGRRASSSNSLNGNLDEFIIWNRVLSTAERDYVWNNGVGLDVFGPIIFTPLPSEALRPPKYYSNGTLKFAQRSLGSFVYTR